MAKFGFRKQSARSTQQSLDEQTQMLLDYGVSEAHIFSSKAELLERLEKENGAAEVVVTSLERWSRSPKEAIDSLRELNEHSASLTSLREGLREATADSFGRKLLLQLLLSVGEMEQEQNAVKKRDSLAALRKRGTPLGPKPKLSQRDVDWIKERYDVFGWGAQRISKALPDERNVAVSKATVMRVLGLIKGEPPYVPNDNHKYTKRAASGA